MKIKSYISKNNFPPFFKGGLGWILCILLLAFGLRIFSLNWDQSQHLHPDERFITMVTSDITLSDLNPANHGYDFYAYGIFPLFITRLFGQIFSQTSYDQIFLIGRVLSAIFDTGIILILYFFCHLLKIKSKTTIIICFLYALAVFPIQLSHFFTVDTFTVFFSTLSIYFFIKFFKSKQLKDLIFSAIILGLALSCKISLIVALPLFLTFIFLKSAKHHRLSNPLIFLLFIFISFRIFEPYAFNGLFHFSPQFIQSVDIAHQMITGEYQYPPNIQWLSTWPLIHPLINIFFFGLGPVLTVLIFMGLKTSRRYHFIFFFVFFIFIYQGVQLAKYMRYFYPIYPFLIIFAGLGFEKLETNLKLQKIFLALIVINTFLFLNIYTRSNSRVDASTWICQNLSGKNLSYEYWDDPLPLNLSNQCNSSDFNLIKLAPFDIESQDNFSSFIGDIRNVDYLVLSSNRFWRSISQNPDKYPHASKFYQSIFNDQSEFKLVKHFYSYPGINLPFLKKCLIFSFPKTEIDSNCLYPGVYFKDTFAEESFTVYDHPEVFIFAKK
jgi:hypothetical protein